MWLTRRQVRKSEPHERFIVALVSVPSADGANGKALADSLGLFFAPDVGGLLRV